MCKRASKAQASLARLPLAPRRLCLLSLSWVPPPLNFAQASHACLPRPLRRLCPPSLTWVPYTLPSLGRAGRLSQQVSPAAGSLHIPGSACLSGTPMQAPLVHLPFSGQTIFSGGSARAAPRQPPQQHQQQPQPPQSSLAAQPSARGPEAVGSMRPHLAGAAPNNSTGAGLARAAAPACAQPMVMGEGSGD